MAKFRKKPVVIEAVQYTGSNPGEIQAFGGYGDPFEWVGGHPSVVTLEGRMTASAGDWVIRGVKRELYFCKPDIFEATYEPAE